MRPFAVRRASLVRGQAAGGTPLRKTTRLKALLAAPDILVLPGVHDALGCRLAEAAGFAALTAGGYGATATLLGRPDSSQLSLTELSAMYSRFCDASPLPLLADADTGFGNVTNVARAVRLYEKAGVAGLFIEDQVFPKRCGHMAGKAVIPAADWLAKIKAALDARADPDLVIMARTDAIAVNGLDDAIERAQLAREAGADLIFVEAPVDVAAMRRICTEVPGPCLANNVETGLSPLLPAAELQAIGYAAVVFPVAATYAVAHALRELFAVLRTTGTTASFLPRMLEFDEFNALVGLPAQREREAALQEFAAALVARRHR
ncbi:MAG: oxaloacetate decarboxylase [Betaproteobacteria bacterium]|nr:oxaloacetate decarboxylase [Betaproteobacteria bacterium]